MVYGLIWSSANVSLCCLNLPVSIVLSCLIVESITVRSLAESRSIFLFIHNNSASWHQISISSWCGSYSTWPETAPAPPNNANVTNNTISIFMVWYVWIFESFSRFRAMQPTGVTLFYKLTVPIAKCNRTKYFYSARVVSAWNSLPGDIVSAPNLLSFKKRLRAINLSKFLIFPCIMLWSSSVVFLGLKFVFVLCLFCPF